MPQLWRDELASWSAASRTLPQLWAMLHNIDAVLGIYYLGLHLWMAVFGDSADGHAPSVGHRDGAAAGVVALIGRRLGGSVAGLASGLGLRPDPERVPLRAGGTAVRVRDVLRGARHPDVPAGHGAADTGPAGPSTRWCSRAAGAANLIALCVVAGHLVIVIWDFLQRTVRIGGDGTPESGKALPGGRLAPEGSPLLLVTRFCVAVVVGAILISPLVIEGHAQQGWQIGRVRRPHVAQLIGVSGGLWQELFASVPAAAVVMLLAVVSLVAARDARRRSIAVYALAFAIVPVVDGLGHLARPDLVLDLPVHAVQRRGLGGRRGCLHRLPRRARQGHPAGAAHPLCLAPVRRGGRPRRASWAWSASTTSWRSARTRRTTCGPTRRCRRTGSPWTTRRPRPYIAANARPGDDIAFQTSDSNHYQVDTAMEYYLRGKLPLPVFQSQTQVEANSLPPQSSALTRRLHTGTPRVWVVFVDHLAPDPFSALPPAASSEQASEADVLEVSATRSSRCGRRTGSRSPC